LSSRASIPRLDHLTVSPGAKVAAPWNERTPIPWSMLMASALLICGFPAGAGPKKKPVHLGPVNGLAIAGETVFSASQSGLFRHQKTGPQRIMNPPFRVMDLAGFTAPDGQPLLLAGGGTPAKEGLVAIINPAGPQSHKLRLGDDLVYAVAVSPSGNRGAAALTDGRILVFPTIDADKSVPTEIARHGATALTVTFSPNGKWLSSGGLDGLVLLTPVNNPEQRVVLVDHTAGVECLAFSPDSRLLASGSRDGRIRLHTSEGRYLRTIKVRGSDDPFAPAERIQALAWGKTGLAGGLSSGRVFHVDTENGGWIPLKTKLVGPVYSLLLDDQEKLWMGGHGAVNRL